MARGNAKESTRSLPLPDDRTKALTATLSELFSLDEPRRQLAAEMSGLAIHYDLGPGWAGRVQLIDAKYVAPWELPAIGPVTAPTAVLIRPDGYVAWVGDLTQLGLADALTTWFGPGVDVR